MIKSFLIACVMVTVAIAQECSSIPAPEKLEKMIHRHIGMENFFAGPNAHVRQMQIIVPKDAFYYAFDLYRTVAMGTGVRFSPSHPQHGVRIGERLYSVAVGFENRTDPKSGMEHTEIVLTFRLCVPDSAHGPKSGLS